MSFFELTSASLQQEVVTRTRRSLDGTSVIEQSQMVPHSDPTLARGEEEQVQDIHPTSAVMGCGRQRGRRHVMCTTSSERIYRGFFGHIYVKKKTTRLSGEQERMKPISEEVEYLFHPSFLRLAFEMNQVSYGGKLSRFLRYCQILPNDFEIFKICENGDLEGFRQALIQQEVPLHAQKRNGSTLLHMACQGGSLELCSLIIELGVDASHEDIFGQKALIYFSNNSYQFDDCVEAMVRLMLRQEHVEEHDILCFSNDFVGPPEGFECMLSPDVYPTELDWRRLPIEYLVQTVMNFAMDIPRWTKLIRKMVRRAEDLHCLHYSRMYPFLTSGQSITLLDHLFRSTLDPIEGAQVSEAWLEILAMEGHDVREYVEVEMKLHEDIITPPVWFDDVAHRFLVFDVGQKPKIEWDWWMDPNDPASLVCDEFRHMACRYSEMDNDGAWVQTWPFIIPGWARRLGWEVPDPARNRVWRHMVDLADSRAARRVARKEMKLARAEGTYTRKRMPGSWVD